MAIPAKLRLFTCFVNSVNNIGKVTSVTLPKLTRKTEDYQGGGMIGSVAVDLGLDSGALDATMVVGGLVQALLLEYGGDLDGTLIRFTGEYYTSGESQIVDVEMRGKFTEIDGGESKQGEDTSVTYAIKNTYYKLSIDDKPLWEIDLLNFVYNRNGENIYPSRVMSALGMGS